ncbi:cytosolic endo-beta-N-acetylglucosaminidase [Struthio camelus]|uniref:cytosolic endo-beta-N-acetylglucosaminidase n=1 Tax=Struthio camelus TaxID=8801 RepID=UPI003603F0AD
MELCTASWSCAPRAGSVHSGMELCIPGWVRAPRDGAVHGRMGSCTPGWSCAWRDGAVHGELELCTPGWVRAPRDGAVHSGMELCTPGWVRAPRDGAVHGGMELGTAGWVRARWGGPARPAEGPAELPALGGPRGPGRAERTAVPPPRGGFGRGAAPRVTGGGGGGGDMDAEQDGGGRRGKRAGPGAGAAAAEAAEEAAAERGGRRRRRSSRPAAEAQGTTVLHEAVSYSPQPLPARQFDTSTTEPVSFFLSGLEELLAWQPTSNDDFNVAATPLAKRQPPLHAKRPRTLVCHDMRGGYLEDRFIQGSATRNPYVFYHWRYIDIFVYFSHHTVTIPPVCWTNAAHRNGVPVLGTFIAEWTEGEKLCEAFLAGGPEAYRAVSQQLARVARHYRFDGWLVNLESKLSEAAARNLPLFLRHLTAEVHGAVPGGLVLWYDSVVRSGELRWQNELNEQNRVFFDACDGLFVNYNWKEEQLERSRGLAGQRLTDVYFGIDVFGRGDVLGGGFDSDKPLSLIRKHGFSAAIFAPGWVYEHLGEQDFLQNENKFWGLLAAYLPTHSICTLPFGTSFSLGMGTGRFAAGQEEEAGPWYDLSAQEIQPLYAEREGELSTGCCLRDAWRGGSSLMVRGTVPAGEERAAVRLFSFRVQAPPKLFLTLLYKLEAPHHDEVTVSLQLSTQPSGTRRAGSPHPPTLPPAEPDARHEPRLLPAPPPGLAELLRGCDRRSHGWTGRCYELDLQDCSLRDLSLLVSRHQASPQDTRFACLLGEVQVLDAASLVGSPPRVLHVSASQLWWQEGPDAELLSLSLTLRWSYPPGRARGFRVRCEGARCRGGRPRPGPPQLLGLAHGCLYRAVGLAVPRPTGRQPCRLELLVEPVPSDGLPVAPEHWGRLLLVYSEPAGNAS